MPFEITLLCFIRQFASLKIMLPLLKSENTPKTVDLMDDILEDVVYNNRGRKVYMLIWNETELFCCSEYFKAKI